MLTSKARRLNPALPPSPSYDAKISDFIVSNVAVQIALFDLMSSIGVQPDMFMGESSGSILCGYADGCLSSEEALIYAESKVHDVQEPSSTKSDKFRDKLFPITRGRQSKRIRNQIDENHKVFPVPSETTLLDSMRRSHPDLSKPTVIIDVSPKTRTLCLKEDHLVVPVTAENGNHLFSSLQELYTLGMNLDFSSLYPKVAFPVSAKTPGLSHLMTWNHQENWKVPIVPNYTKAASSGMTFTVDLSSRDCNYLKGHVLNNQVIYPAAGYICMAWHGLAMNLGVDFRDLPIVIKDISFEKVTLLSAEIPTEFRFMLLSNYGNFEIHEQGVAVVRGKIEALENQEHNILTRGWSFQQSDKARHMASRMSSSDIYQELGLRGYTFSSEFKSIQSTDFSRTTAKINWNNNWVTLLDSVLQLKILSMTKRSLLVPTRIQQLTIDPSELEMFAHRTKKETAPLHSIPVRVSEEEQAVYCPGLEFLKLSTAELERREDGNCIVEQYKFVPFFNLNQCKSTKSSGIQTGTGFEEICGVLDLVLENVRRPKLKVLEVLENIHDSIIKHVQPILQTKPGYEIKYAVVTDKSMIPEVQEYFKPPTFIDLQVEDFLAIDEADFSFKSFDLIIASQSSLKKFEKQLKLVLPGTFVLGLCMPEDTIIIQDFLNVATKSHKGRNLQLLKPKFVPNLQMVKNVTIDGDCEDWLSEIKMLMKEATMTTDSSSRIYLTSQKDPCIGIIGLLKCLRLENGGELLRCIFDPQGHLNLDFESSNQYLTDILEKDLLVNVVQNGQIGSFRYIPYWDDKTSLTTYSEQAYADFFHPGEISSVRWIGLPSTRQFEHNGNPLWLCKDDEPFKLYTVNYSALNFRDIVRGSHRVSGDHCNSQELDSPVGYEFSGKDKNQNRVMGITAGQAIATSVMAQPSLVWNIPDEWTLGEAATVPVAYYTAYYALLYRARAQQGQSILIHLASGGVGQAALSLAMRSCMDIYVTVGSEEKRRVLKELFPDLKDDHMFSSRNCEFAQQILSKTGGKGVNIILNSLSEEKLHASIRCLAENGKFLEIGKFDMAQNSSLGMNCFLKNIEVHGVDVPTSFRDYEARSYTSSLLKQDLASGVIRPLPRQVFECNEVAKAFQHMSDGKHIGKVVIKIQDEADESYLKLEVKPCTYFHPDKMYIIAGGLGGLGLEVANFLVERGCRFIALTSRSGITTGYQAMRLQLWKANGVIVLTPKADLSCYLDAENFLKNLTNVRTVGGIFNSCLVLKDALIENQTPDMFQAVAAPKIQLTKNLDELSRQLCPDLDYFVVSSSAACGRGNLGQSAYGLSNSAIERMCEQRQRDGFHALAIQWGVVREVGAAAKIMNSETRAIFEEAEIFKGTAPQSMVSVLKVLDLALNQDVPVLSSIVLTGITASTPQAELNLLDTISKMFRIHDIHKVPTQKRLSSLGLDSISCMHIKNKLERDYELPMLTSEIRNLTFEDLFSIVSGSFRRKA